MRDFSLCSTKNDIKIADASCSASNSSKSSIPKTPPTPSIQNSVTSLYTITLSTQHSLLLTLSWSNQSNNIRSLSINFNEDPALSFKLSTNSRFLSRKKGSKRIESKEYNIEIFWDFSSARYQSGPEPIEKYYLIISVNGEVGLCLGDMGTEAAERKLKFNAPLAKSAMVSRREVLLGNRIYSTTAQFGDDAEMHEILICCRDGEGSKNPVLSVWIDRKSVINVKKLQWNFRGNQTISVDGLHVDLMWDVHDWFFPPTPGNAVFMFRPRSDSRVFNWDKLGEEDGFEYSLLICVCKRL